MSAILFWTVLIVDRCISGSCSGTAGHDVGATLLGAVQPPYMPIISSVGPYLTRSIGEISIIATSTVVPCTVWSSSLFASSNFFTFGLQIFSYPSNKNFTFIGSFLFDVTLQYSRLYWCFIPTAIYNRVSFVGNSWAIGIPIAFSLFTIHCPAFATSVLCDGMDDILG